MCSDRVSRRVALQVYAMVAHAHPRRPVPPTPVCVCEHSDDQHFGVDGELHCAECPCPAFVLARFAEAAA